jgi:hypothetical protein
MKLEKNQIKFPVFNITNFYFMKKFLFSLVCLSSIFFLGTGSITSVSQDSPSDPQADGPSQRCYTDWEVPETYSSLDLIGVDCCSCDPFLMHNRNEQTTHSDCDPISN